MKRYLIHSHIDWENVLSGKAIDILLQTLNRPENHTATIPKNTLWRHLKNLKTRGIITQNGSINSRFQILSEFLVEYQNFFLRKIAATASKDAVILWQKDGEFLMRAPKTVQRPPKGFLKTATSIFQEYDLPLFSEFDIYFYSTTQETIRPEDAVLHTLLIERNSVRYTTYALLLLKKTEKQISKAYLLQEAERLGLRTQIIGMLQFLEAHTRQEGQLLPTWNEFVTKANDYAVIA